MSARIRVGKLHRLYPHLGDTDFWYYTPDGHIVGPFDREEDMEEEIDFYYEELGTLNEELD